ncbi:MAG: divergent PAP2 family protein [Chloroflexi bacterium]|nr:divergent PAP2 family protein [Chloroflexota bacterium]
MTNKELWLALSAWAIAQTIKVVSGLVREKRLIVCYFFTSGGMPSSHSATVSALATAVAAIQGMDSAAFAIAVIVAAVVMYDAAGVRQAVGRQSVILDRLVREFREKRPRGEVEHDLRQFVGHTPFQVIAGSALGIVVALIGLSMGRG